MWNLGYYGAYWGLWSHFFMASVHSYVLLLVLFLVLYIFIVGNSHYVYMCGVFVNWVILCFRFVCKLEYFDIVLWFSCILSRVYVLCVFGAGCVPRLPMRTLWDLGWVGGSHVPFCTYVLKIFQFFYSFSWLWGLSCLFELVFDL